MKASQANGGILSLQDFAGYTVQWEEPDPVQLPRLHHSLRASAELGRHDTLRDPADHRAVSVRQMGLRLGQPVHYLAEAERRAFADRNTYLGDPAFVHNPIDELLSAAHAEKLRATILPDKATPSSAIRGDLGADRGRPHHALFGGRQVWQCRCRHLHRELPVRHPADRRRHRLLPQRRDG